MYEIWTKQNFKLVPIEEDENIKNIHTYVRGVYTFNLSERPKCKICGSDLKFIKKGKKLIIDKCLNEHCETNNPLLKKGAPIKWKAFLPDEILLQQHNNHVNNNSFNINFLIQHKGLTLEEAINSINNRKEKLKESGQKNKGHNKNYYIQKHNITEEDATKFYKTKSKLCVEYYIKHGYTEENAKEIISNIQHNNSIKNTKHNFPSKQDLINKGIDVDIYMKEKSIWCIEYYLKRGYTKEEAINKIKTIQANNANKITNTRNKSIRCVEYWINHGYTNEQAKLIISSYQKTFSKEICIQKYGYEKGIKIFKDRQIRWQQTLHDNGTLHVGYSKISQDLFNELKKYTNNEIYYGSLNKEWVIRHNKHNYIFDFTDLTNNKIIEFQGDIYHANPRLFNDNDKPNPWHDYTAKEIWLYDNNKQQIANLYGFDVLYIWEMDYRNNKQQIIEKCKKFLNYE